MQIFLWCFYLCVFMSLVWCGWCCCQSYFVKARFLELCTLFYVRNHVIILWIYCRDVMLYFEYLYCRGIRYQQFTNSQDYKRTFKKSFISSVFFSPTTSSARGRWWSRWRWYRDHTRYCVTGGCPSLAAWCLSYPGLPRCEEESWRTLTSRAEASPPEARWCHRGAGAGNMRRYLASLRPWMCCTLKN